VEILKQDQNKKSRVNWLVVTNQFSL
jgi:hypothetical protein